MSGYVLDMSWICLGYPRLLVARPAAMTANAQLASFDGAFGTKDYKYLVGTCAHCGGEGKLLRFADFTICTGNKKLLGLEITCRQAGAAAVTAAREGRGKSRSCTRSDAKRRLA